MKIIKIFLASSSELKNDREQFETFINRKNKEYIKKSIFLELVLWEDFLDHMSSTRLQDEYNEAVSKCDVFVSLFYTKVGQYTEEEFLKALETFKSNNKPLIYTYFNDSPISPSRASQFRSLLDFKDKLSELGHFYKLYKNIDDLKYLFEQQLNKFIPRLTENIKANSQPEKQESVQFLQSQIRQLVEEFKQERSHNQQLAESLKSQAKEIEMLSQKLEDKERSHKQQLEDFIESHNELNYQLNVTHERVSMLKDFENRYQQSNSKIQESIEEQKQLKCQLEQLTSDNYYYSQFCSSIKEELDNIKNIKTDKSQLEFELSKLNTQNTQLQEQITSLKTELEQQHNSQLSQINSDTDNKINSLRQRLKAIEDCHREIIGYLKHDADVKSIESSSHMTTKRTLTWEEHQLAEEYNHDFPDLLEKIMEVSETQKSISDRSLGESNTVFLEEKSRGMYGIITQDNYHYLVPSKSFRITDSNYKTVQAVFECRNYQKGYSERFELLKPATVIPLADNQQWQVQERGILEFELD